MTQLTLQRQSFGFVPADDETRKALAKVPIGSLVTREWRKVRNSKHHRMRFAGCRKSSPLSNILDCSETPNCCGRT